MIERDVYLGELIRSRKNGFPKVITGIRRCGKSFLLKEIYRNWLIANDVPESSIIILELDNDLYIQYRNPIELGRFVRELCRGKEDCYVFIDEIQLVDTIINPLYTDGRYILAKEGDLNTVSFVEVVLGLSREKNIDLYVTGSNSKMLSSDIVTEFRDKATQINLAPLSFEEYYKYSGESETEALYTYMQYGGMPLAVLQSPEDRKRYLSRLFETTYFADILEHNHLNRTELLDELCNIISTCTGELLNAQKIADTFKSRTHKSVDKDTVTRYIEFFRNAFMIREARRYDIKGRSEIGALRKYYFTDTGLRNARLDFAFPDEGQMLENIVFNELIYNGYSVSVGTYEKVEKDKDGKSVRKTLEIDFFAVKNTRKYYIQVSADIADIRTREREIRPFISLRDEIQKIIVINRPVKEQLDENGFTVIGVTDFLLRFIK